MPDETTTATASASDLVTNWESVADAVKSTLVWFRNDLAYRAPELHDEAWQSIAETITAHVRAMVENLDAEPVEYEYGVQFPSVHNRPPIVEWCRNEGAARSKVANLDRSSLVRRVVGTPEVLA